MENQKGDESNSKRILQDTTCHLLRDACRMWGGLIVLLLITPVFGEPPPEARKVVSRGGYEAVAAQIGNQGKVRVIVKVSAPFQPQADSSSEHSHRQMKHIATAQETTCGGDARRSKTGSNQRMGNRLAIVVMDDGYNHFHG